MVMIKLKLVNDNTANKATDAANSNEPAGDVKHETRLLKELVYPWSRKGDRVIEEGSHFSSMKSER